MRSCHLGAALRVCYTLIICLLFKITIKMIFFFNFRHWIMTNFVCYLK